MTQKPEPKTSKFDRLALSMGKPLVILGLEAAFYFVFPFMIATFLPAAYRGTPKITLAACVLIMAVRLVIMIGLKFLLARDREVATLRLIELSVHTHHGWLTNWILKKVPGAKAATKAIDIVIKLARDLALTGAILYAFLATKQLTRPATLVLAAIYTVFVLLHLYVAEDRSRSPFLSKNRFVNHLRIRTIKDTDEMVQELKK